jgi:bifunctional non-homologous end joining protein LigD
MLHHRICLEPCLPRPAKEPPAGAGWIHEIKHDGFRILARRDKDRVRLATRNGSDFTARYPKIVTAVESLPVRSCVIDGEAIVVNEDASRSSTSCATGFATTRPSCALST